MVFNGAAYRHKVLNYFLWKKYPMNAHKEEMQGKLLVDRLLYHQGQEILPGPEWTFFVKEL